MDLATVTAAITATLFSGASNNICFAHYVVILPTGRVVFAAVTRDIGRETNPLGLHSVTVGGKLSKSTLFDVTGAVVKAHGAWFRRLHGEDACPLYTPAETLTRREFREIFGV